MENIWIILSLIAAFTLAASDALTKKALSVHNEYLIAWLRLLLSLPFLYIALLFVPVPQLKRDFYIAFIIALPLEIITLILYIKALKVSPLSLTVPFLSLTPMFLIVVAYIILGEKLTFLGAIGVLFIVAGSYTLNIKEAKKGLFEPFAAIKKEKGSIFMIITAFIYSVTASLVKMAIENSSPVFFAATYITVIVALFTPIALYKGRDELRLICKNGALKQSILPGMFHAIMLITSLIAVSLTAVAYMISVKRLSLLISVIFGFMFFKESGIRERLAGAVLMLGGFVLIVLSQ
jgi:drug/metabolite transporter (DMT)-like permease